MKTRLQRAAVNWTLMKPEHGEAPLDFGDPNRSLSSLPIARTGAR